MVSKVTMSKSPPNPGSRRTYSQREINWSHTCSHSALETEAIASKKWQRARWQKERGTKVMERKWQRPWSAPIVSMTLKTNARHCHTRASATISALLSVHVGVRGIGWVPTTHLLHSFAWLPFSHSTSEQWQNACCGPVLHGAISLLAGDSHVFYRWKNWIPVGWDTFLRNTWILSGSAQFNFTLSCLLCGLYLWLTGHTISFHDLCRVQFFFALCVTFWPRFTWKIICPST